MSISKEDILAAFQRRAATRYYDGSRKISEEDMNFILELGRLSPSSVGSEPWRFVVVQNRALRDAIKPVGWGVANQLDDCSHLVVILAKKNARYDSNFMREVLLRRGLSGEQLEAGRRVTSSFKWKICGRRKTRRRSLIGRASRPTSHLPT